MGLAELLNNKKSQLPYNYIIENANRHIVMLKEEKDGFVMFQEEFNKKHFALFRKMEF